MSKAIQGAAMLAGAVAMGVGVALDPALLASPLYDKAWLALIAGGISMEAGAIADALTQQRGMNITTRQPAAYRQIIYGTQRVGGVIVYQSTTGGHFDQYNFVIVLATHECWAIENLYLDGRRVFWNVGSGGNSTRNGYNFGGSAGGGEQVGPNGQHYNFDSLVYCEARYGDQLDGDVISGLTANDPNWAAGAAGKPWLGGCTYVYLKVEYDQAMFPQVPEIRFTVHGKCDIPDPRTNTSGYSTNPALIVNDLFRDPVWGIGDSSVNQAQLIAAANICDETLSCAGGALTEARYAASWHYDTSTAPGEAMKVFLEAMGGRLTRSGGEWYIWPAAWIGPSSSWDENALTAPPQWNPYRKPDELVNRVNGTYIAPNYPYNVAGNLYDANGWYNGSIQDNFPFAFQPTNYPQYAQDTLHGYASDALLTADGRQLPLELELKAVLSVSQAQRLAKIALMRNRQQGAGVLKMKVAAFEIAGIDVIQMSFAQLGWSSYQLEVSGEPQLMLDDPGDGGGPRFTLGVPVQDTSQDVYAWSSAEELTVYDVPSSPSQTPYFPAAPTTVTLTSGAATAVTGPDGVVTSRVLVQWTDPLDILVTQIIVQWRAHGASTWLPGPTTAVGAGQAYVGGVVGGQSYDFRVASLRPNGAKSGWVEIDNYTVSATYSRVTSSGLSPNAPWNAYNDATLDSLLDGTGSAAEIRIYGPGGVGTAWDFYNGQGSQSYSAGSISGLAFTTTYYICVTPGSGGFVYDPVTGRWQLTTPEYQAFTNYGDALSDEYIYIGGVTTCDATGAGGGSGGGSGTGTGGEPPRSGCSAEGEPLDTTEGPLDNREVWYRVSSGIPVFLAGRHGPERIVHAEWMPVDRVVYIAVGDVVLRVSDTHMLRARGHYRRCLRVAPEDSIETRIGYLPHTIGIREEPARVLRLELEGPGHEYSIRGVWTHNAKIL